MIDIDAFTFFSTMLLALGASLLGVLLFVKKETLMAETLCHATYPGVALGAFGASFFCAYDTELFSFSIVLAGSVFAGIAYLLVHFLREKFSLSADSALTFILASFFGMGVLIASYMQTGNPSLYAQIQLFLFGQVATLVRADFFLFLALLLLVIGFISLFFHPLRLLIFDPTFARCIGIKKHFFDALLITFTALSIVIGARSVGIVLISGLLVAPVVSARQFCDKLSSLLLLSGFFSLLATFLAVVALEFTSVPLVPLGPLIILVLFLITIFSLLFAPANGFFFKRIRRIRFSIKCRKENLLKALWKEKTHAISLEKIKEPHFFLKKIEKEGLIKLSAKDVSLTEEGKRKGARIVRLHRLWESYLVSNLGNQKELVHMAAEDIEHILEGEAEAMLSKELSHIKKDPHRRSIPPEGGK